MPASTVFLWYARYCSDPEISAGLPPNEVTKAPSVFPKTLIFLSLKSAGDFIGPPFDSIIADP